MFSKWYVMSQREVKEYCNTNHNEKSVIISINNSFEMNLKLPQTSQNKVVRVLSLAFDDVLKNELIKDEMSPHIWLDRRGNSVSPISTSDCQKIHAFVREFSRSKDSYVLIVQCEMGISRSAAVMAAILKYLYNDDMPIYKNSKYRPNPDVYRAVYNELSQYIVEDSMTVDTDNLRFGLDKTPFKYAPIFEAIKEKHEIPFVPSVEACTILPELKNVVELVPFKGTGLPYIRFNFATFYRGIDNDEAIFNRLFSIDENMYEQKKEDNVTYKDSVSYMLTELHRGRQFPDVYVKNETVEMDDKKYNASYYFIILYNQNSPYFYQDYNTYEEREWEDGLLEIEYTFPGSDGNHVKTWGYIPITKKDIEFYLTCVGSFVGALIKDCYNLDPVFYSNFYNQQNMPFNYDVQIIENLKDIKDKNSEKVYEICCADYKGQMFNITFSIEEWTELKIPNFITGFRMVKF